MTVWQYQSVAGSQYRCTRQPLSAGHSSSQARLLSVSLCCSVCLAMSRPQVCALWLLVGPLRSPVAA